MATAKKNVLPKRIAGLKALNSLRRSGTRRVIARNPLTVEFATAAIIAAAPAFAATDGRAPRKTAAPRSN